MTRELTAHRGRTFDPRRPVLATLLDGIRPG
jgi:hypothetical protein